ncbi:hypothetical protein [Spirosoma oryzicola]|uniref:hypothetical protein n=1 Tax=Spirosoma oryzicola TaxID=2898794 RepID=UPI001E428E0D|nr:hypothetical protein [Spirosoma oryzicola]UHG93271.1 hypothetical protein LQ777_10300 [Spirosoma oryzicola]
MATPKKLPKARKRYFIQNPVVVLDLADYERIYEHLVSMGLYSNQPKNIKVGLDSRHRCILKEIKDKVKMARRHYNISEGARLYSQKETESSLNEMADVLLSR